ncbi:MAG: adenosylcobinamide-GDP ribazoletransferase [Lachnospiraceae bacterium]|nr:adenosylcobinamide-GDP ribazoletransferase [Lachnospiraceae bacterium]
MLKALFIAFSMYSRIPVPKTEWDEKSMRYALCFFPLVGVLTGVVEALAFLLSGALNADKTFIAAIMCVIPVLISGGIHMDGFIDTVDALSSHKSREEKLRILKDPHIGAFAVIYSIVYHILYFGFLYEATGFSEKLWLVIFAAGFVCSRIMSGMLAVSLKKAKTDGTLKEFSDKADKKVRGILTAELFILSAALLGFALLTKSLEILCALGLMALCIVMISLYFKRMAYREFGGITGDLCGYYLQLAELFVPASVVITRLLWR